MKLSSSLRNSLLVGLGLACLTFSTVASASPSYPQVVQQNTGLPCTPSCTLCHTVDPGVPGTATQPFVTTNGVVGGGQNDILKGIIEGLEDSGTDSDGDTKTDYLELLDVSPTDPNIGTGADDLGPFLCSGETAGSVAYGCGGGHYSSTLPSGYSGWAFGLGGAALLLAFARLRRRATR